MLAEEGPLVADIYRVDITWKSHARDKKSQQMFLFKKINNSNNFTFIDFSKDKL